MVGRHDAYDAVVYPGQAYPDTHPDRMAVMAMLHGLDPAPVGSCRVLEIGCNAGANLIPMAYAIPGSEFVGFDVAGLPIARGQRRIAELGLTNIRLFQADLMQADLGEVIVGRFDYIIAHGVYAWVPEAVSDRLLGLCRERLTANGIAFISYNALPGGHARQMVREIVLQRFSRTDEPARSVADAMEFLRFVIECRPEGDPFRALLEYEAKQLQSKSPEVVYHDELAREFRPVSFSSFMADARRNGLQYVCESVLPLPNDPCFQPQIAATAKALAAGDAIVEEQTLDFARMRVYRETLLCGDGCAVDGDLCLEAFVRLRLASQAESSAGDGAGVRVFTLPGGIRMETGDAGTVELMEYLIEAWPRPVPFAELTEFLEAKDAALDAAFLTNLMRLVVTRMVQLHAWEPPVSSKIATRPRASTVSRQEAATQSRVTTLLHGSLRVDDPMLRQVLLLLDGKRDRKKLLRALRGEFSEMPEEQLAEGLEMRLHGLQRAGVLHGDGLG